MDLRARLKRAREQAEIKPADVARKLGVSAQAVSQWESPKGTRPDMERMSEIAALYQVRVEWLLTGKGPMRDDEPNVAAATPEKNRVPVIDFIQAGKWSAIEDQYPVGGADEYITTDASVGKRTFALTIKGLSMAPDFQPGDRIIIDPDVMPQPGDFVVAKRTADQEATFKKYRPRGTDGNGQQLIELVPLNADWPLLTIDAKNPGEIVGTMVEHRRYRRY